jgi:hypothetical protein
MVYPLMLLPHTKMGLLAYGMNMISEYNCDGCTHFLYSSHDPGGPEHNHPERGERWLRLRPLRFGPVALSTWLFIATCSGHLWQYRLDLETSTGWWGPLNYVTRLL